MYEPVKTAACQLFFEATAIPVYLSEGETVIPLFTGEDNPIAPPVEIRRQLLELPQDVAHLTSKIMNYYGIIRIHNNISLILGPVSSVPYTKKSYYDFFRTYQIPIELQNKYRTHMQYLPLYSLDSFIHHLLLLYYMQTNNLISKEVYDQNFLYSSEQTNTYSEEIAVHRQMHMESGYINTSYEMEQRVTSLIESGDLEGLYSIKKLHLELPANYGHYSNDLLQQKFIIFISAISAFTSAAIRGGLFDQAALVLKELYIREALTLSTPEEIDGLLMQSIIDFTRQVSEEKSKVSPSEKILYSITYIRNHISMPLTVEQVAANSGYSRSHFSRIFKEELGFSVKDFITNCRLSESRLLLKYTDISIGDISNRFCFANQSHFQRMFKKKYGLTPLQFRMQKTEQK